MIAHNIFMKKKNINYNNMLISLTLHACYLVLLLLVIEVNGINDSNQQKKIKKMPSNKSTDQMP